MQEPSSSPDGLLVGAALAAAGWAVPASSADLPASTLDILENAKIGPAVLAGVDKELAVPLAMVDAAKKEGTIEFRLDMAPEPDKTMIKPFMERYPFAKIECARGVGAGRAVKPLVAYKAARHIADIVGGFGSSMVDYLAADALAPIGDLPAVASVRPDIENEYLPAFFGNLKPQLRRERINRLKKLASIGEFDVAMPSAGDRVKIQLTLGLRAIGFGRGVARTSTR